MKQPDQGMAWMAGACLVLLIGIGWTLSSVQHHRAQQTHIERKLADRQSIAVYQLALDRQLAAVRAFDELAADRPTDLAVLLRAQWPGIQAEVRRRDSVPAWGAWQAHRMEVSIENIALNELGRILAATERERPPWRLVEGNILAADQRPGAARATLVFEGLSK